jgi:tubulin polyglutamylase TTLL6/13
MYNEGLARFATQKYEYPNEKNMKTLFMHLTNYAINKESENYIQNTDKLNDDVGSKRSFTSVMDGIELDFGE